MRAFRCLGPRRGLVSVADAAGVKTIVGQSPEAISTLLDRFREQLVEGGSSIHREDNEGHEAELYFTTPSGLVGSVQQRRVTCPADTTRFSVTVVESSP